eukprot:CAMPEP_0168519912 /NCGR_PEP_ID=MMETSP0405-20121227/7619_1 /TAXON_ID=498012 /ORGANISM="Trichosphaerium sp, Strain Am-I-7 wt" /LENGTH=164 /DNA_ID=CAMNT_0008540583 /DNA_START=79 /DNA_END=570 /DNA_ORIENTATION=-
MPLNFETLYQTVSMWSLEDSPSGHEEPYIHLSYTINKRPMTRGEGLVQFWLFTEQNHMDFTLEWMFNRKECPPNSMALFPETGRINENTLFSWFYNYTDDSAAAIATVEERILVTESSPWNLVIIHCGHDEETEGVVLDGYSEWKNPYGYVEADSYPLLIAWPW